jgi:tRNA-intron endonuclease
MDMETHAKGEVVRLGPEGRERFYDSRGYGRPQDGDLLLSPVEAAHLLYRGDLKTVDGHDFSEFFASVDAAHFLVYKDLRDRGFYLSPARKGWVDDPDGVDFVVYPRGAGPWDDTVEHRVRVVAEGASVPAAALGNVVLAVVDEESELTYLETTTPALEGTSHTDLDWTADATLLDGRALVWAPPIGLHEQGFYGQPLDNTKTALQLSLVEAAYLAEEGVLRFEGGYDAVVNRGRAVEGDRFERRLAVYAALRARGVVPKTGFKFGADFRTYATVDSIEDLGHSERLVRVLPADHVFAPRDLSLDVRLAHGVRKEMTFALIDEGVHWLAVRRLTP